MPGVCLIYTHRHSFHVNRVKMKIIFEEVYKLCLIESSNSTFFSSINHVTGSLMWIIVKLLSC